MNAKENKLTEYKGKEYTTYEATQRQRQLETYMRALRRDIKLMERGAAAKDDILNVKIKYRVMLSEYADFSGKMGLPEQRERIFSDGIRRVL
jgi:hypothetical protein